MSTATEWTQRDGYVAVDNRDRDRSAMSDVPKRSGPGGFYSHHHRLLRSRGGKHSPANITLLIGSGTTSEHGWVHKHVGVATVLGYIVPTGQDPAEVPIYRLDAYGTGYGWFLQTHDGQLDPCGPPTDHPAAVITAALESFDELKTDSRLAAVKFL